MQCGQTVVVVDASVVVVALADDERDGDAVRERLAGERLAAPDLLNLEVLSVLRRHLAAGRLLERRAALALADLIDLPIERVPTLTLLPDCWKRRDNLTIYDAAYAALARWLDAPLLTGDAKLAHSPGLDCEVELLRFAR